MAAGGGVCSDSAMPVALEPGGPITCEYRELHGANVYCAESVLLARVVSGDADGVRWTLERPSAQLDTCAELLEALGLSAAEVRARERWPLGSLLRSIAEQLIRRVGVPPGAPAPVDAADPERELVLALQPAAPVRASCELATRLVSASATGDAAQRAGTPAGAAGRVRPAPSGALAPDVGAGRGVPPT